MPADCHAEQLQLADVDRVSGMPLAMSVFSVKGLLGWGRRLGGLTVGAMTRRGPLAGPPRGRAARWSRDDALPVGWAAWLGRARAPYGPLACLLVGVGVLPQNLRLPSASTAVQRIVRRLLTGQLPPIIVAPRDSIR